MRLDLLAAAAAGVERINHVLPHALPHTGKRLYGNNGAKSAAYLILLEQKWPESVGTQRLEGHDPVEVSALADYRGP